jgi:hypothetical protein
MSPTSSSFIPIQVRDDLLLDACDLCGIGQVYQHLRITRVTIVRAMFEWRPLQGSWNDSGTNHISFFWPEQDLESKPCLGGGPRGGCARLTRKLLSSVFWQHLVCASRRSCAASALPHSGLMVLWLPRRRQQHLTHVRDFSLHTCRRPSYNIVI